MATGKKNVTELEGYGGGLVTVLPASALRLDASPDVSNVWGTEGGLRKRPKFVDLGAGTVDETLVAFYRYRRLAALTAEIIAFTEDSAYRRVAGVWDFVPGGEDCLTSGVDDHLTVDTFLDNLVFSNGRDHVKVWDGTAGPLADLGGGTDYQVANYHIARQVGNYCNRLFLLAHEEDGVLVSQRLRFSNLGTLATYTDDVFFDVQDKPDALVRALRLSQKLILYKDTSIVLCYYVGGDQIFEFVTAVESTGLLAPRTLRAVSSRLGDGHLFLARDGVKLYTGSSNVIDVSGPVRNEILEASAYEQARLSIAFTVPRKNLYVLMVPEAAKFGAGTLIWVLDYVRGIWWRWYSATAVTAAEEPGALGSYYPGWPAKALLGIAKKAYTMDLEDTTTWDGEAYWCTKDLVFHTTGDDFRATVDRIIVEARGSGALEVQWSGDAGASWATLRTVVPLGALFERHQVDPGLASAVTGKRLRLRLRQPSGAVGWFEVRKVSVFSQELGDR